MIANEEIDKIQVFYERIGQEIYNTRKKNYSWGFRVIEPQFLNFSERIILVSRLYEEETLVDLNSVVFKLFTEFNNNYPFKCPSHAYSRQGDDPDRGDLPGGGPIA